MSVLFITVSLISNSEVGIKLICIKHLFNKELIKLALLIIIIINLEHNQRASFNYFLYSFYLSRYHY